MVATAGDCVLSDLLNAILPLRPPITPVTERLLCFALAEDPPILPGPHSPLEMESTKCGTLWSNVLNAIRSLGTPDDSVGRLS